MSVSSVINARLERFFRWLGAKVGRHPWAFIFCSVSVALVAGSGITKLENESDYFTLWYPRKSQAWTDWQYQKRRFGPEKRVQSLVAEARGGGNVFEKAALLDVLRLHTASMCARQHVEHVGSVVRTHGTRRCRGLWT